ncbi:GNAT family N-acetyltransferase [Bacillus sp. FJAT-42315]|uniref:GNAT family N-acetyltransferase n=1 Tax=Bacillus sp. FJAT-42315 TaxID=2014077 RepID=UPI000C24F97E|nr:GNAT family protein [Bacillus sp. FJAT-42315]
MNNCLVYKSSKLVPYTDNHHLKTVEWLNKPEVYESFGLTKKITIDSHSEWINSLRNTYIWAVYSTDNDIHCGNLLLFYNPLHHSAFFQIYLGEPKSRGKKLGYYSLIAVLEYAFETLKLNRIWLQVFPDNKNAINLYEKLGFVREGVERESHYSNSLFKDQLRYSILKREWMIRKEAY